MSALAREPSSKRRPTDTRTVAPVATVAASRADPSDSSTACASCGADRRAAYRLFVFSISYLFVLFAAVSIDRSASSSPSSRSSHGARIDAASGVAAQITRSSTNVRAREV